MTASEAGIDLRQLRRVLIIKPSSLGDIVHTMPAVHDLKLAYPHLEITWLANTEWMSLLEGRPDLAKTLEFPRQQLRGLGNVFKSLSWLLKFHQQCQPDIVLDFQGLLRSGLISVASYCRQRIGLSDAREGSRFCYKHVVPVNETQHAVDRYRAVAHALGVSITEPPTFSLPQGQPVQCALPNGFIALHPFSRGEGKSLSLSQIEAFCQSVTDPVVLLGRCEAGVQQRLKLPSHCLDLLNETSIPELIWCLRQADRVISVDSGPMHLATALNPGRVLSIHTWSDPRKVGPFSTESAVWKSGRVAKQGQHSEAECKKKQAFDNEDVPALVAWAQEQFR